MTTPPRLYSERKRRHAPELGYAPRWDAGRWQRTPPTERGVYPVVSREGGLWTGAIALYTQAWAGWWWSERIASGRDLTRLPPCPSWDDPDVATGVDGRPLPARTRATER